MLVPVPYEGIATVRGQKPYATFLCRAIWKLHVVEAKDRIVDVEFEEADYEDALVAALSKGRI